jgi:hypothetical protein
MHSLVNNRLALRHRVKVSLRIEHRQVLDPILLLVGDVVVHMCPGRQRNYVLLDEAWRCHFGLWLRLLGLFKRVLILHIRVDQLGNYALIVWRLFTFPQADTRIVLAVH